MRLFALARELLRLKTFMMDMAVRIKLDATFLEREIHGKQKNINDCEHE